MKLFFISVATLAVSSLLLTAWKDKGKKEKQEFYQLKIFSYNTSQQEQVLDAYLQNALLPALRKNGVKKAGVFKALANDTATNKKIYVLVPYKTIDAVIETEEKIFADAAYQTAGDAFINTNYKTPAYTRIETILLKAFPLAPQMQVPVLKAAKKDRVYELRSYEGPSEKIFKNKVQMFNDGDEIGLFKRLNFNAVFYAEVVAGSKMPNLMYMTSFESMEDRNAHWKAFGSDSAWMKLKTMPAYQNNVSHIDITFLRGVEYSDF